MALAAGGNRGGRSSMPCSQHFHLYQIDLRGHGDSGKPETGYTLDVFVADLEATLQALGLERPRILGHSLGARGRAALGERAPFSRGGAGAGGSATDDPPGTAPCLRWLAAIGGADAGGRRLPGITRSTRIGRWRIASAAHRRLPAPPPASLASCGPSRRQRCISARPTARPP